MCYVYDVCDVYVCLRDVYDVCVIYGCNMYNVCVKYMMYNVGV